MKKLILSLFVLGALIMSTDAVGQNSQTNFIPTTSYPIATMIIQNGIEVNYEQGTIGTARGMGIGFHNITNAKITFTYTLKNKNGDTVFSSPPVPLEADGYTGMTNTPTVGLKFSFVLADGTTPDDYKMSINIKE